MELVLCLCFADFILILLGSIFTIVSYFIKKQFNLKKEKCTYKTIGNIVEIEKRETERRYMVGFETVPRVSAFNCYEYEYNLEKLKVWSNVGNMPGKFQIGQQVTVYCNPDNPNEYYIEEESTKTVINVFKFVGIGMFALAMIFTTIIIVLLIKR